jgi:hypothetical protein
MCGRLTAFSVVQVVLVALDVGLHELRRDQSHRVTLPSEHTRPVVRAATRLQARHAPWQPRHECRQLAAAQAPAQHRMPVTVHPVQLKDALGKIDPDVGNSLHVTLLRK